MNGNQYFHQWKWLATVMLISSLTLFAKVSRSQEASFRFTGRVQQFIVPEGVYSLQVEAVGASGGKSCRKGHVYGSPGLGGKVQVSVDVNPGQKLDIYVGGLGYNGNNASAGVGGYNGGANGGFINEQYTSGGGGGATDIRHGNGTLRDRMIVAGGGGASGKYGAGGNGGGLSAADGYGEGDNATGGTQHAGGLSGSYYYSHFAQNGEFGKGGSSSAGKAGGGGAGGWYGGGGGAFGDGAGGSSYTYPEAYNVVHSEGANEGYGYVNITWNKNPFFGKSMTTASQNQVRIFPNPTDGDFSVDIPDGQAGKAEVWLAMANGATLEKQTIWLTGKSDIVRLSIPGKVPGLYFLKIISPTSRHIAKVVMN